VTPLYPQKLALTSPTGGGRSVGIVHSRTKAMEFSLVGFIIKKFVTMHRNVKKSMPPHVSTNRVAILSEVHSKVYITNFMNQWLDVLNVNSIWFKVLIKIWGFKGLVG
jgi:hypothetical protein